MASATFRISGPVLRDILGLPKTTQVEDVYVEVSHRAIPAGADIEPTFKAVNGRPKWKSWGITRRPKVKQAPVPKALRDAAVAEHMRTLRMAQNIDRSYAKEFTEAQAHRGQVRAIIPVRYLKRGTP